VGFRSVDDVKSAVAAGESFKPIPPATVEAMKAKIESSFDKLCTTCNYCKECPQGLPVAGFMESYNHYLLYGKPEAVFDRLRWHWDVPDHTILSRCTQCKACERVCTQKLPILARFDEILKLKEQMRLRA
jgi:uncharacterized protein